jgi:2-polyprenyl-6-methoxyphenol hydroxylase-like FAD-dependent oxidoreductase
MQRFPREARGDRIKIIPDTTAHLRGLLLPTVFDAFEATCAETRMGEATLNTLDASFITSRVLFGPKPYTVERGMFRQSLIHGLEDDVHRGKSFSHFTLSSDPATAEGVTAHFKDGSSTSGSLLVAADGGRSAVRRQFLPDAAPLHTRGVRIYGKTPLSPELLGRLNPKLLRWFHICRDNAPLLQETILGPRPIHLLVEPMVFPNRATRDDLPADYIYRALLCPSRLAPR